MKVVERLGLLKMDFLGLKTVTVVDDTLRILAHQGIELDLDARAARRPGDVPHVLRRPDERHLPVRVERHARPAAARPAVAVRGSRGVQRALPPGRALGRHGRRVHPAQARQQEGRATSCPRREPILRRDLRRHRLPGAGDADRGDRRRLHHGRGRRAAQGDGQEERRGDGGAEGEVRRRAPSARASRAARPRSSGTTSSRSPATASTRATAWPTRCSPTRPPTSRRTTRSPSWRRC